NHATELVIDETAARRLRLVRGEAVFDIAHLESGPLLTVATDSAFVDVLGTRFSVTADAAYTAVRVSRGAVRVHGAAGQAEVRAGEEASVEGKAALRVFPALDLAGSMAWSELTGTAGDTAPAAAGIGQLRAYRPGEDRDKDWRLSLATHKVTVRIVGNVARTEIEEVFQNDSAHTLEGVYQFPLPADARIDHLALDVEDGFEEGAFVDKERAQMIWAGVIDKAAPKKVSRPKDEIIWVPGPWRDPALLEWQRGGRFELRIFPIPAHGSRTIKIGYTQTIDPHGDRRRYVYPLAHGADDSNKVGRFELDVRVAGADPGAPVSSIGYPLAAGADADATRLSFAEDAFVPRGDLVVEYKLPNPSTELRAWTFQGDVAAAPTVDAKAKQGPAPEVIAAQKVIAADLRPTALFALRPELPGWAEQRSRDYVIVLDSSQSMVGERYTRANELATAMIAEMDRRDQFWLVTCDLECRVMSATPRRPGAGAAKEAQTWLATIEPAGSSNLALALGHGVRLAGNAVAGRERFVVYVGDGMASVGPRRTVDLAAEAARLARETGVAITTTAIGGDADADTLAAVARAGGGHYLAYVPGQRAVAAAMSVLETSYGVSLRNVRVTLPQGLTDIAPGPLPTIRAGQELLVAARFSGTVRGDVIVEGSVGGKPFVNRYPITLEASTARGNGFVPRMWASLMIGKLDLAGGGQDRVRAIALSKAYAVMSRHTSLLVLESDAMFKAFGVDRAQPSVRWSGEEEVDTLEVDGVYDYGTLGSGKDSTSGAGFSSAPKPRAKTASRSSRDADSADEAPFAEESRAPAMDPPPARRGRGMVRMRKVWFRTAGIDANAEVSANLRRVVADFEVALKNAPDSRERHRDLVQALAYTGELDRAYAVASQWLERDRLDPQALVYMADILGRKGEQQRAVRLLSGVVDLQPDDQKLHQRLVEAYGRVGDAEHACAHRIVVAELALEDAAAVGAAMRCNRALGRDDLAASLRAGMPDDKHRTRADAVAAQPETAEKASGELVIDATWQGATDLDLSIVTPRGTRLSWMGGRDGLRVSGATAAGSELLALRKADKGNYLVEISRVRPGDTTPVTGKVTITLLGQRRVIDFGLTGDHAVIGRFNVKWSSRLEPF
ncbi:MAG TPA: VIT domain-containing protein, partial [Kofleriaceae bacterium]|nr:VIT domain-containing protein [Kofleriaceae bacterium]